MQHQQSLSGQLVHLFAGAAVPAALAKQLEGRPLVRQWMVRDLGVSDLETGVPIVKVSSIKPGNAARRVFRLGCINNIQLPDATIVVAGQKIHVHKLIIERVCPVLGNCWRLFGFNCKILCPAVQGLETAGTSTVHSKGLSRSTAAIDSLQSQTDAEAASSASVLRGNGAPADMIVATLHCECAQCLISSVEYDAGVMFIEFMYTGRLRWPQAHGGVPDHWYSALGAGRHVSSALSLARSTKGFAT